MTDKLTKEEAYAAMFDFLAQWYSMTNSADIGGLLGSMSKLPDGGTVDPALQEDWEVAVEKALSGEVETTLRLQR